MKITGPQANILYVLLREFPEADLLLTLEPPDLSVAVMVDEVVVAGYSIDPEGAVTQT